MDEQKIDETLRDVLFLTKYFEKSLSKTLDQVQELETKVSELEKALRKSSAGQTSTTTQGPATYPYQGTTTGQRNTFTFDGGEYLTTMGATWFVSYAYWHKNPHHLNWRRVSTYKNRMSVFNNTKSYHKFWLQQVVHMDENNLDKNSIGLSGLQVKQMASELLKTYL